METTVDIGKMDQRVQIYRITRTMGTQGQPIETRSLVCDIWAAVDDRTNDEQLDDSNIYPVRQMTVTVYARPISENCELRYDGVDYNILSTDKIKNSPFMEMRVREILKR